MGRVNQRNNTKRKRVSMAIIKKFNPDKVYISSRMINRMRTILFSPLSIVEAPTGYGKTTVVRQFLKENNVKYIWFNIDNDDKNTFFNDFCNRIETFDINAARQIRSIGYPNNAETSSMFANILLNLEFREKTILVFDNYQLISDENFNRVIKDLSFEKNKNLRVVILTQAVTSSITFELVLKKKLNYISKSDFELTKDEILEYYKECGIKLLDEEADFLYTYTEGWISALFLQMLSYNMTQKFEPTVSVDNLICNAIWNNISSKEQDLLITMSIFNSFSLRQAYKISLSDLEMDEIEYFLKNNSFIKYDSKARKYYIHSILKYFLNMEFEKMELVFRKEVYRKAGEWYCSNEEYFNAIKFFYKVGSTKDILAMNYTCSKLIKEMVPVNKDIFLYVVNNASEFEKSKYCKNYLIFIFALFMYNEWDLLKNEFEKHMDRIKSLKLSDRELNELLGELKIVEAYVNYNNIDDMCNSFEEAFGYLKAPSVLFSMENGIALGNPSVLSEFFTKAGNIQNEIESFDKMMQLFYKLFSGNSKGSEALFRAEVLMHNGNLTDANMLCDKAIYMSKTREQNSVEAQALMIQSIIDYYNGNYEKINKNIERIKEISDSGLEKDIDVMCALIQGFIGVITDTDKFIPMWIKDVNEIEKKCNIYNLGFAYLIYGKYLITREMYQEYVAISGQLLKLSERFNNVIYKIYFYLFLSEAKNSKEFHEKEKAKEYLVDALELAYKDNIVIPFIHNYNYIGMLLKEMDVDKYNPFIENINTLYKKTMKNIKVSQKASKFEQNFGLTNRELEVARLAAQRLSNKEIADILYIAESTVKSNMKVIFSKLEISSRSELKNFF